MPRRFNAGMSIALFAVLGVTLVAPGCDSFTGMVPTEDADHPDMVDATKRAPSVGESVSDSGDTGMHAAGPMPGPGQMDMPDSDGVEMANMMMNVGLGVCILYMKWAHIDLNIKEEDIQHADPNLNDDFDMTTVKVVPSSSLSPSSGAAVKEKNNPTHTL